MTSSNNKEASDRGGEPYRVMVVDDSAVIRGMLTKTLEADKLVEVVASVSNGQMALSTLGRKEIDVVVLDIEMPVMDGLTALPKMLELKPDLQVIMASTLTRQNAEISMRALDLGAKDYIPKPTTGGEIYSAEGFKRELTEKVKVLGRNARGGRAATPRVIQQRPAAGTTAGAAPQAKPETKSTTIQLRQGAITPPEVLAIGSSTGGPQALLEVMKNFADNRFTLPILITQHMPPTFTTLLAEHITRVIKRPCVEAKEGDRVVPGSVYVAPGDYHMTVKRDQDGCSIHLAQDPPENFCRPAVDPMLRSMAAAYGARMLVVILTGMGSDGCNGSKAVVEAGGSVVAQDEATSVVWGMPGAVATAGLCSAVLPLNQIGSFVAKSAVRPAA